jgi:hypothetical protein
MSPTFLYIVTPIIDLCDTSETGTNSCEVTPYDVVLQKSKPQSGIGRIQHNGRIQHKYQASSQSMSQEHATAS